MKRIDVINFMRTAGYHNDDKQFVRLRVENRVSFKAAKEAFLDGKKQRSLGYKCHCAKCEKA